MKYEFPTPLFPHNFSYARNAGDIKKMMKKEEIEKLTGEVLRSLPVEVAKNEETSMKNLCKEFGIAFLGR